MGGWVSCDTALELESPASIPLDDLGDLVGPHLTTI
jgi:hypothetical protein